MCTVYYIITFREWQCRFILLHVQYGYPEYRITIRENNSIRCGNIDMNIGNWPKRIFYTLREIKLSRFKSQMKWITWFRGNPLVFLKGCKRPSCNNFCVLNTTILIWYCIVFLKKIYKARYNICSESNCFKGSEMVSLKLFKNSRGVSVC